ncbi:MAG: NADH:ubiquinone reductase (Na(+)-transporting) subunit C [Bacteroidetes bacterium]|nr:NADH:ubiquinone reductase (Na(+)-transporting) subunit C [Bacteroidota bacterium]MBU1720113.1 NADH:ubiquinone reductase (Na(+)-transporting) subunit C [Bacteroidota bacterium]
MQHSNSYIFRYSAIMVIIVAAMLAATAELLKPKQLDNIRIEKMQFILSSAGIRVEKKDVIPTYNKFITKELGVDLSGNIVSIFQNGKQEQGTIRPFEISLKEELDKISKGAGDVVLPLYICNNDGKTIFIVPVYGKGLWGPLWGNMAFADDMNTVVGATFDHKAETPGLGSEIATTVFQAQFANKQIFDPSGEFVSVSVVKGGVKNSSTPEAHGVDAISGGTITSNAVSKMLHDCLINYVPYFKKDQ